MFKKSLKPKLFVGFFPQSATERISLQDKIIQEVGYKHYQMLDFHLPEEKNSLSALKTEENFSPEVIFIYNFFEKLGHTDDNIHSLMELKNSELIVIESEELQKRLLFSASNAFFPFKLSS